MAVKELRGQPLNEEEYEKIRTKELSYMAAPPDYDAGELKDLRSGLIADVHTDLFKNQVLYEATGEPYIMLALVGNEGVRRLTIGVAFNHYEFTGPLTTRYTDADWRARVSNPPKVAAQKFLVWRPAGQITASISRSLLSYGPASLRLRLLAPHRFRLRGFFLFRSRGDTGSPCHLSG